MKKQYLVEKEKELEDSLDFHKKGSIEYENIGDELDKVRTDLLELGF